MTSLPLPLAQWRPQDVKQSVWFYPLVGLFVGACLFTVHVLPLPPFLSAVLVVATWLGITGALHFDGFCDIADAAFAAKSPQERQHIVKDPAVGAYALAAALILLLLKLSGVMSLEQALYLIVIPILSRSFVLISMTFFKVNQSSVLGRSASAGRAKCFGVLGLGTFLSGAIVVGLSPLAYFYLWLTGLSFVLLASYVLVKRMAGLSGDAYGAIIESSETVMLVVLALG